MPHCAKDRGVSKKSDKLRQIRIWPGTDELIEDLVERSVTKASFATIGNMALVRGIKVLEKEIALKPKREK